MGITDLCIISYNSRGFGSCKQDFIKSFPTMGGCDTIICNQENFLLKNNEYMAKNILPGHHVLFKPASKDGLDGRPTNGIQESMNLMKPMYCFSYPKSKNQLKKAGVPMLYGRAI